MGGLCMFVSMQKGIPSLAMMVEESEFKFVGSKECVGIGCNTACLWILCNYRARQGFWCNCWISGIIGKMLINCVYFLLYICPFLDPHVKVCGSKADVMKAKCHILEMFDTKVKLVLQHYPWMKFSCGRVRRLVVIRQSIVFCRRTMLESKSSG